MASTRTTQADMLRTVYQPRMRVQFNLKSILLQRFRRNMANYAEGKEISIPIHAGRTGGYGWSGAGKLPPAGEQEVARANFNYSRLYGRVQIDRPHMRGARTSYAAEARPYDLETRSLVRQLRTQLNFFLFGDGTGILTTLPAQTATFSSGTATVIVDSVKGLHKNQMVDLLLKATGTYSSTDGWNYGKITSISTDPATGVHTVKVALASPGSTTWDPTAFNAAETDYGLYLSLDGTTSSYNNVLTGLLGALSKTNTYGGINRATAGNEYWHGQQIDAGDGTTAAYLSLFEEAVDGVEINSEGSTDLIITTHQIWTQLAAALVPGYKRWGGGETRLNGWARALDFNGIPIVRDKHCPDGHAFFLDTSTFKIYQDSEGAWLDEDGAILHRVTGYDAFEAAWSRYLQLVCDSPNSNLFIYDIKPGYPAAPS